MQLRVSTSIGDFPVFPHLEESFKESKQAGVDGVELIMGVKSRWKFLSALKLSQKYALPITSIHQPVWSGLGISLDESFVRLVSSHGVSRIVFHPLCFYSMHSHQMQRYFEKLSGFQKKYSVTIMLENMLRNESLYSIDYWLYHKDTSDLSNILSAAEKYDFKINYDTSHTKLISPQADKLFQKIFPKIDNIHLSSFSQKKEHLPLTMGDFNTKDFLLFLKKNNYKGLITFEIFYPRIISFFKQSYEEIKQSVEMITSLPDKSS